MKIVFQGSLQVAAKGYTTPKEIAGEWSDEKIPKATLRTMISEVPLHFVLDYPFREKYEGKVKAYANLRDAFAAIRRGFRTMYRGSKSHKIPGLRNRHVVGDYGDAYHVIGDLYIERLRVDGNRLIVDIGS